MNKKLFVSLVRFVALIASLGYLVWTMFMIFLVAPGQMTLNEDMFNMIFAVCLVLLALLVQRKDSNLGRWLSSWSPK
jgi:hypothetical protein